MIMKFSRLIVLALMLVTMAAPTALARKKRSPEHKKCVSDCAATYKKAKADCKGKKGADRTSCMKDAKSDLTKCKGGCPK